MGQKWGLGLLCPFPWGAEGELGSHLTSTMSPGPRPYSQWQWHPGPSNRLAMATIDTGGGLYRHWLVRKLRTCWGCCAPFRGGAAGSLSNAMAWAKALGPRPTSIRTKWHLYPSNGLAQYTNVLQDRHTDKQRSNSIGRSVTMLKGRPRTDGRTERQLQ